eukprot:TRINITY_DN44038_c0_g1_i1.p1 TRINITY_DN44038_c0_g1~~TRINITY_DN44038_c0_g1_i1.p1  ORF type:complete len:718 (+),score=164.54 TRINITY_DN44038_c0_g1_i1:43-2154(+)
MGRTEVVPGDEELADLSDAGVAQLADKFGVAADTREGRLEGLRGVRMKLQSGAEERRKRRLSLRPENGRLPKAGDKVMYATKQMRQVTLEDGSVWSLPVDTAAEVVSVSEDTTKFSLRDPSGAVAENMYVAKFRHMDGVMCAKYVEAEDPTDDYEHIAMPVSEDPDDVVYTDAMGNPTRWHLADGALKFTESGVNDAPPFAKIEFTPDNITITMQPTGWYSPLPREAAACVLSGVRRLADAVGVPHNFSGDTIKLRRVTQPPRVLVLDTPNAWPQLSGRYLVQPGQVRGFSWWMKDGGGGYLSINWDRTNWIFALEQEQCDQGSGWITCVQPPKGMQPHAVCGWGFTRGIEDPWEADPSITVCVEKAVSAVKEQSPRKEPEKKSTPAAVPEPVVQLPQPAPPPPHSGQWRGESFRRWCSFPGREEGQFCQHGFDVIETPHWSCCGDHESDSKLCCMRPQALSAFVCSGLLVAALVELSEPARHLTRVLVASECASRSRIAAQAAASHPSVSEAARVAAAAAVSALSVCSLERLRAGAAEEERLAAARALCDAEEGAVSGRYAVLLEEHAERMCGAVAEAAQRSSAAAAAELREERSRADAAAARAEAAEELVLRMLAQWEQDGRCSVCSSEAAERKALSAVLDVARRARQPRRRATLPPQPSSAGPPQQRNAWDVPVAPMAVSGEDGGITMRRRPSFSSLVQV